MDKQYGINIEQQNGEQINYTGCDTFDFFPTLNKALDAAMAQMEADTTIDEMMVAEFDGDDIEDFPLYLRREDGDIHQYQNEQRLWMDAPAWE